MADCVQACHNNEGMIIFVILHNYFSDLPNLVQLHVNWRVDFLKLDNFILNSHASLLDRSDYVMKTILSVSSCG